MTMWQRCLSKLILAAFSAAFVFVTPVNAAGTGEGHAGEGHDRVITAQQQDLELLALKLLENPIGVQAAALAGRYLRNFGGVIGDDAVFNAALRTTAFCGALTAANADANYPQIHAQGLPVHRIGGREIPDSRCGIPNADTIYRFIPVDGISHYVIMGHRSKNGPVENNFTLASYDMSTINNINGRDLSVDADGSFTITVDPEPANGRRNHLQSRHDAFQIWIRDTLGDWSKEKPNRLSVRRLDPNPAPGVDMNGQLAVLNRYISYIINSMPQSVINGPANTFKDPRILGAEGAAGYLVTQAYSDGRFDLKDDEALILKLKLGAATYAVVPVTNVWGTDDGKGRSTGAMNNFQAERNADGTYTFVVSKRDPAIFNWVDTGGLNQGTLYLRWAGFPGGDLSKLDPPTVSSTVVKLSDIEKLLPQAHRLDAEGRKQQQQKRLAELYGRQTED